MYKLSALAILLASCGGDGDVDFRRGVAGQWRYTDGDGNYFCDDGQAGSLSVSDGSQSMITLVGASGLNILYNGKCTNGFGYEVTDANVATSVGDTCLYSGANAFGEYDVTLVNSAESFITLSDDGLTLSDSIAHKYQFKYADNVQNCEVYAVSFAEKVERK